MIEVATLQALGDPDMGNGTFCAPDLTTYCGLGELGLVVVAARFVAPSNNEDGVVQVLRSLLGL